VSYIDFNAITKTFPGTLGKAPPLTVLDNFSLQSEKGEFIVIIGPSGCGKSTILNILAGFAQPTTGTVRCAGEQVTSPAPERGVVFQEDTLFPWLTVKENILFGPRSQHLAPLPDIREKLKIIGLQEFENHYPAELSGGMKQRVALARVLINEPAVLLMDEPFGGLDALTREEMQALLTDLHSRLKPTVLFVTHDVEEAVFLADRVLVLSARPGRLRADIKIDIPRPRMQSDRELPAFTQHKSELRRHLQSQTNYQSPLATITAISAE
jgi:ABC-type nitrate/sulfonate/bicarbonate transport system ATPase subunit